jgi:hypothetical protein
MTAPRPVAHPGVAHCARSFTHAKVRSLTCSFAPSAGVTGLAEPRYVEGAIAVA